ncbi:hypothetical protein SH591_08835 [Sphingomonas sp. LY54]|nr:hypothetical protein [Sphingomonas sp. LY54]WRP27229.1 hypothetical protein SH591_08835 [Sphingomonas sp. LY54]
MARPDLDGFRVGEADYPALHLVELLDADASGFPDALEIPA